MANFAQAAAPKVISAKYEDSENTLVIEFDQPVLNDTLNVLRGGISLDGDNGGIKPDLTLTGGAISGSPLSSVVKITLKYQDQQTIETMSDNKSLQLVLLSDVFRNEALEGNSALGTDAAVAIEYIADENAPAVTAVLYDAGANTLSIDFNTSVNGRQVELIRISVQDATGATVKFGSINEQVNSDRVASTMEIALSPKHQQLLEKLDDSTLGLVLQSFAFIDENRNSVLPISSDNPVAISYLVDENPTNLVSAQYDAGKNNLVLVFNEKIVTTFWGTDAVNAKGITIQDVTNNEIARLSGQASVSVRSNVKLTINVLPADQRLVENLSSVDNLKITIDALAILDEFGNGIKAYTLDDSVPVEYLPEAENKSPVVEAVTYDALVNKLSITFGNISGSTRGIDTTAVDLAGIVLDDDNGGTNPNVILSGGEIVGIKTGVPKFIRVIEITVNNDDEIQIESFLNKENISIGIDALSFFYESYTKTRNGNRKLEVGEIMVSYAMDEQPAQVNSAKYDFVEKTLKLELNKLVDVASIAPTSVTFGGVKLSGGSIQEENATATLTIDVSSQDQTAIDALAVNVKAAPSIQIDAEVLQNLDKVANEVYDFMDGDLNDAGDRIVVGYGRNFWDKSYEAFPTQDQQISASMRAVGNYCYIYVADDIWASSVTEENVSSLLQAFETSTPADATKGIYTLTREIYGQEADTDGDPNIYIVLLDLRDEFGPEGGRNARASDIPRAGDFDIRHELPVEENAHSNTVDMVFIDGVQIVEAGYLEQTLATYFTKMILHGIDNDEDEWLAEGLASFAMDACGYGYTNFRFPAELPSLPADIPFDIWTGWQGGDPQIDLWERNRSYLMLRYIFEEFGGLATITAIAADEENGFASIDNALSSKGTTSFGLLGDVAIAGLADAEDDPTFGNTYGFESTELRTSTIIDLSFKADNYTNEISPSAIAYLQVKSKNNPGVVSFNGDDNASFSLSVVTLEPLSIEKIQLGAGNEGQFNLPAGDKTIFFVVARNGDGPVGPASFIMSKDFNAPEFFDVVAFQNPSVTRVINLQIISSERLYKDVPPDEGPAVKATGPDFEREYPASLEYFDETNGVFNYKVEISLPNEGDYTFTISGQDVGGNDFNEEIISTSIKKVVPTENVLIADARTGVKLEIPAQAISKSREISSIYIESKNSLTLAPYDLVLDKMALLTLPNTLEQFQNVGVYRTVDGEIEFLNGTLDKETNTVRVEIDRFGKYSLGEGSNEDIVPTAIPEEFNLFQNYPNPFNPVTTIRYDLPQETFVQVRIFDVLGKEILQIVNENQTAGVHQILVDASHFSSGVYFYEIIASEFHAINKMMLLK
jgi:hypothetical protein